MSKAHRPFCHRKRLLMIRVVRFALAVAAFALLLVSVPGRADEAEAAWAALGAGGHVALMRHATAPGTGDPANFRLEDCTTQRNLSAAGQAEAQAIGAAFRSRAIDVDGVYSSQWCRCLETARLLDLGPVTPFLPLNSFFRRPDLEQPQMAAMRTWLSQRPGDEVAVLVTHQVVVTALTDIFPRSGEIVVARPRDDGTLRVVGRIPPPR